jgi:glycerophosphoryl diester phosphodiesterase
MSIPWHRVGHRGAPKEFPANTMQGFQRAVEWGCTMVECDIRQAADGVLVLAHDEHVTDRHGQTYSIVEQESAFLRGLDLGAGEGVPTLTDLVAWARGRCAIMADMKCEGGTVVVEALKPLPLESKIVPGAGTESRARFREWDSTLPLSLSLGSEEELRIHIGNFEAFLNFRLDTAAVTWHWTMLNAERIARLHERGLLVYAWTVDDLPTMQRLREAGADGVISNRPDLLAQVP